MELWKLLLITLLSAVVLGCVFGVLLGKYQVKKLAGNYRPLLNVKERIVYGACILLGAGCIAVGLLYTPPEAAMGEGMMLGMSDGTMMGEEFAMEGDAAPGGAVADAGSARLTPRSGGGGTVVVMG